MTTPTKIIFCVNGSPQVQSVWLGSAVSLAHGKEELEEAESFSEMRMELRVEGEIEKYFENTLQF